MSGPPAAEADRSPPPRAPRVRVLSVVGTFPELSETFIYRKAVGLSERGHRVTIASRQPGDWSLFPDRAALPPTMEVRYLPPDYGWRSPAKVGALLRRGLGRALRSPAKAARIAASLHDAGGGPLSRELPRYLGFAGLSADLVHYEFLSIAALYPLLPRLLGVPFVVSCRGSEIHLLEQKTPGERERFLSRIRAASAVHCVSSAIAAEVTRASGRAEGLWVNRPAVDVDAIAPKESYRPRVDGCPRIVAVGRLVWIKGFDYLLAALARLKERGVRFEAEIIGDGPMADVLRFSVDDLGLRSVVTLAGAVRPADVPARLREADVYVLSSHKEGISNAVLEGMAAGLPIVTTAAGGMGEVVSDGVEGRLVPVRDIPALEGALHEMLTDPALRERAGRAARRRAESEFSLRRQVDVFERMYAAVLGDAPEGASRGRK